MNETFEKILNRLEEMRRKSCIPDIKGYCQTTISRAEEIVQEVAEEYNGGWISVKDRLPDKAGSYLVIGKSGGATVTRWYMPSEFYPEGHLGGNNTDWVRYWMPRPEPPKERD